MATLLEWVLLVLGVSAELACSLGVVVARSALDRLHYAAAGTVAGPVPIALAVLVKESFTQAGLNALLVAAMLVTLGPLLAVETASALRRGERH